MKPLGHMVSEISSTVTSWCRLAAWVAAAEALLITRRRGRFFAEEVTPAAPAPAKQELRLEAAKARRMAESADLDEEEKEDID